MTKIAKIFSALMFLIIVSFYAPNKAQACYIYFNPARPAYNSSFVVNLVNGSPKQTYSSESCNSDTPILSGVGCGLSNPIVNILNPMKTDENGKGTIEANSNEIGILWMRNQPKFFYFSFTLKNGDAIVDSCRGKVVFVPIADAVINDQFLKQNCQGTPGDPSSGVDTAIGCVPTSNLTDFLRFVLKWVFFASGGIIVLMVIATGYTIITSQGNPEKLQAAKENIVALLSGLAMIAFSLILLQVIGANILGLPTF